MKTFTFETIQPS